VNIYIWVNPDIIDILDTQMYVDIDRYTHVICSSNTSAGGQVEALIAKLYVYTTLSSLSYVLYSLC